MTCEWCGEDKLDVKTCDDPFLLDVYQERVPVDICGRCYELRAEDI